MLYVHVHVHMYLSYRVISTQAFCSLASWYLARHARKKRAAEREANSGCLAAIACYVVVGTITGHGQNEMGIMWVWQCHKPP